MDTIQITLLGDFSITVNGKPALAALACARKAQQLMQYLLLAQGRAVPHAELIRALWGTDSCGNPDMALRALLHRIRKALQAENLAPLRGCILTNRGTYQWNLSLSAEVDLFTLRDLLSQFEAGAQSGTEAALAEQVLDKYQSRLLPDGVAEPWVERASLQLHVRVQSAAFALLKIRKEQNRNEDVVRICRQLLEVDPYSERVHLELILALNACGRIDAAAEAADDAARLGYPHLGSRHAVQSAYRRLNSANEASESDLSLILDAIDREDDAVGAYICDYAVFRALYLHHRRMQERYGMPLYAALLTLGGSGSPVGDTGVEVEMNHLQRILRTELRRCDVAARYSNNQFVALLSGVSVSSGQNPLERVKAEFYHRYGDAQFALSYRIYVPAGQETPVRKARMLE